jgi:tetratricopeptide (TPR) repeat protein
MKGYSSREVARLLGLSLGRVRSLVRAGFVTPERDGRDLVFSFQDLVLLRTAKGLMDASIAPARVKRVLRKLKDGLPDGRPLTGVAISAEGNKIVVRDENTRWDPEDGQALFDFEVSELARKVAPIVERAARKARSDDSTRTAVDWFELGCNVEVSSPDEARDAYRRAIELEPGHTDAHVNLGRLLHEAGELDAAEAHYRMALDVTPDDAIAWFNLGLVLEGRGQLDLALSAYQRSIAQYGANDVQAADAHYQVARVYEKLGQETSAVRHLKIYRKLTQGR